MNIRLSFILLLSTCFLQKLLAQDIIYTTAGNKINAKVLEIGTNEIKYKDFSNIEGPNYVIYNTDVVLINFANGTSQIINANAPSLKPKKDEILIAKPKEKLALPENLYYLNPNMISINALALLNGDIAVMYDREFLNSHLGLTALGSYNINPSINQGFNAFINEAGGSVKKKYDAGLGINFMPQNTKRGQYFLGVLGKYMAYDYETYDYVSGIGSVLKIKEGTQTAVMITNGWFMRITPNFNLKIFGSAGFCSNNPQLQGISQTNMVLPKFYFGYCFGYRF